MLPEWSTLPEEMKTPCVREYYDSLYAKQNSLIVKRIFDMWFSAFLLIILSPVFAVLAFMIKRDSKGPVIFKQTRVTTGNRDFTIYKFRSMVEDAPSIGSGITVGDDSRITKVGAFMRKYRLDELPQLLNVFLGDMSFVGTRPESRKYVDAYSPVMYATLLLPAGITSDCSIKYKDEDKLLSEADDVDKVYITKILPQKMKYNLRSLKKFSCGRDLVTMIGTLLAVV